MTMKSIAPILFAGAAAFSLAIGTAFPANDRVPDATAGYAYPNFWAETSANQQSNAATAQQGNSASVGIYAMREHGTGTYLFPPNPYL